MAFERGPLVYGVEDTEKKFSPAGLTVAARAKIEAQAQPELLGGVTVLKIGGGAAQPSAITAIPYFAWNNRGPAAMAVWLKRTE